jgi:signal peptide peptidase SppA
MNKILDLSKMATKLANGKWLLPPVNHSALCRVVDAYMAGKLEYMPSNTMPVNTNGHEDHPQEMDDVDYVDSTAVIKVCGVLSKGVSEIEEVLLGLADVDEVSYALDIAAADGNVKDIVLVFFSPGGETLGIEELGRKIKLIDETVKPVYGWTESQATSAAFWCLSQTRKIGMMPSAQIGGVGVYSLVLNITRQMKDQGTELEIFSSGKYKMMGHEFRSLTDEERKIIQEDVDRQHEEFNKVVLSKRPQISKEDLEGLAFEGREALEKGFCDTLHDEFAGFLDEITK